MAATINTFENDLATARTALATLKRDKGARPAAARAFLEADGHDAREAAVEEHGAGFVRRGLREAAIMFERKGQQETADVFWALRDDIDLDGDVFTTTEDEVA